MRKGKKIPVYDVEKNIRLQQRVENVNSAAISADANIICFIPQYHGHQHNVLIAEKSLEW